MEDSNSKRNILNKENGFNIRVNLYIIRYLYYHIKKADMFMVPGEGKRKKSVDIEEYIMFSRPRLYRIFEGKGFEVTSKQSETIIKLFNISTDYFKKNGKLIEIHEITKDDWYCFFHQQHGEESVNNLKIPTRVISDRMTKVQNSLDKLVEDDYITKQYDTDTPLYRIHYYFKNGVTFKEVSRLNRFLENLELLKISDWKEIADNPEDMKKYLRLLERHYEYVGAYIKCNELEKID